MTLIPEKTKVFIGLPQLGNEIHMFRSRGYLITGELSEADIVVFTGGQDISPSLYGERPHIRTNPSVLRDTREIGMFRKSKNKFRLGLCRGGQLLNVLSGGKLWQDIDNHHGDHPIRDVLTSRLIRTTSIHHQAFKPGKAALRVAVAKVSTRKESEHEAWYADVTPTNPSWETDYEILFYPETRSLCIQGHPEMVEDNDDEFVNYTFELINRYYPMITQPSRIQDKVSA